MMRCNCCLSTKFSSSVKPMTSPALVQIRSQVWKEYIRLTANRKSTGTSCQIEIHFSI